jgi:hypothetical protein
MTPCEAARRGYPLWIPPMIPPPQTPPRTRAPWSFGRGVVRICCPRTNGARVVITRQGRSEHNRQRKIPIFRCEGSHAALGSSCVSRMLGVLGRNHDGRKGNAQLATCVRRMTEQRPPGCLWCWLYSRKCERHSKKCGPVSNGFTRPTVQAFGGCSSLLCRRCGNVRDRCICRLTAPCARAVLYLTSRNLAGCTSGWRRTRRRCSEFQQDYEGTAAGRGSRRHRPEHARDALGQRRHPADLAIQRPRASSHNPAPRPVRASLPAELCMAGGCGAFQQQGGAS